MSSDTQAAGGREERNRHQDLLAHAAFVEALARDVAYDGQDADDLIQETFLAALRARAVRARSVRGWLATILRNTARQTRRAERRRRYRERSVALLEPQSSVVERLEEEATRERLIGAVEALREPYRSSILLRYLDGMPPRTIAAQQGVPVRTVTTRLSRGLALLRDRLAPSGRTESGERKGRRAPGFLGLGRLARRIHERVAAIGVLRAAALLLVGVPALGLVLSLSGLGRAAVGGAGLHPPSIVGAGPTSASALYSETGSPPRFASVLPASEATDATHADTAAGILVTGRVVDVSGKAVANARVAFRSGWFPPDREPASETRSDERGRFALPLERGSFGCLAADTDEHAPIVFEQIVEAKSRVTNLVVAKRREVHGRVLSADGRPVEGARVSLNQPSVFPTMNDGPYPVTPMTRTDADGGFVLRDAFRLPGTVLLVKRGDHGRRAIPLDGRDSSETFIEVVMEGPPPRLHGRVIDGRGLGAVGALVTAGEHVVRTGPGGGFALPVPADPFARLRAIGPGSMSSPVELDPAGETVIRLNRAALTLSGVLSGSDDEPVAGCEVWIANPTVFGMQSRGLPDEMGTPRFLEDCVFAGRNGASRLVFTASDGTFELEGLRDTEYVLVFIDRERVSSMRSHPVRAGTHDASFRFPAAGPRGELAGRVVGHLGDPIPGACVTASMARIEVPIPGRDWRFVQDLLIRTTVTDDDGWFTFEEIPARQVHVAITGVDVFPQHVAVARGSAESPLTIRAARRARLELEVSASCQGVTFGVLDREGAPAPISMHRSGLFPVMDSSSLRRELTPGARFAWDIPDVSSEVVLYEEDEIVGRIAIQPTAGALTSVDL